MDGASGAPPDSSKPLLGEVAHRGPPLVPTAAFAASAAMFAVVAVRLQAALFGPNVAFLAAAALTAGVAIGGVLAHFAPSLSRSPASLARVAYFAGLAAAAAVASVVASVHVKQFDKIELDTAVRLVALELTTSLPIAFAAASFAVLLQNAPRSSGLVASASALGVAVGGALAIPALLFGAQRAGLVVGIAFGLTSLSAYVASARRGLPTPRGPLVATFVLASLVLFAGDLGEPWLKLKNFRWTTRDKIETFRWTELGLVTVEKPVANVSWIRNDGVAPTAMLEAKAQPSQAPLELAYSRGLEKGATLVLDAGGGGDVRQALKGGAKEVWAVDPNPIVVRELMKKTLKEASGDLYDKDDVHLVLASATSFLASTEKSFSVIVLDAAEEGNLAQNEATLPTLGAALYDIEAFTTSALDLALAKLEAEGMIVIVRPEAEADRLIALGAAAIARAGISPSKDHLYAVTASHEVTLFVKKAAFAKAELQALRHGGKKFKEVFAPDNAHGSERAALAKLSEGPTFDRPVFALGATGDDLYRSLFARADDKDPFAVAIVASLGVGAASLVLALLGLARRAERSSGATSLARALMFFFSFGAASSFLLHGVGERLVLFLGEPVMALSLVVVALFLGASMGAVRTSGVDIARAGAAAGRRAQILTAMLAAISAGMAPLFDLALLLPVGYALGGAMPLAARLVASSRREAVGLSLAWSGAGAALAFAASAFVSIAFGFTATSFLAALFALVAAASVPRAADVVVSAPRVQNRPEWLASRAARPPIADAARSLEGSQ